MVAEGRRNRDPERGHPAAGRSPFSWLAKTAVNKELGLTLEKLRSIRPILAYVAATAIATP